MRKSRRQSCGVLQPPSPGPAPAKLRVLLITGRSDHGGGPAHVLDLLECWGSDVDAVVACPHDGVYASRYRDRLGAANVWPLPHRKFHLRALYSLQRRARGLRFNIVHSHGASGGWYARLLAPALRVPAIHTFHGVDPAHTIKSLLHASIEQALAPATRAVVAVSHGEATLVARRYPLVRQRLHMIPNGIAVDASRVPERTRSNSPLRIVSFSRPGAHKRPEMAIAIAQLANAQGIACHLDLIGVGMDAATWQAQARTAQGVACHGPVDHPDEWLQRADVYLSTSSHEGMPLALLEAWRSGAVVIATNVVGNRDLVRSGVNGLLYEADDVEAAVAALARVAGEPAMATRLRQAAFTALVNEHDRKQMAAAVLTLYRQFL